MDTFDKSSEHTNKDQPSHTGEEPVYVLLRSNMEEKILLLRDLFGSGLTGIGLMSQFNDLFNWMRSSGEFPFLENDLNSFVSRLALGFASGAGLFGLLRAVAKESGGLKFLDMMEEGEYRWAVHTALSTGILAIGVANAGYAVTYRTVDEYDLSADARGEMIRNWAMRAPDGSTLSGPEFETVTAHLSDIAGSLPNHDFGSKDFDLTPEALVKMHIYFEGHDFSTGYQDVENTYQGAVRQVTLQAHEAQTPLIVTLREDGSITLLDENDKGFRFGPGMGGHTVSGFVLESAKEFEHLKETNAWTVGGLLREKDLDILLSEPIFKDGISTLEEMRAMAPEPKPFEAWTTQEWGYKEDESVFCNSLLRPYEYNRWVDTRALKALEERFSTWENNEHQKFTDATREHRELYIKKSKEIDTYSFPTR